MKIALGTDHAGFAAKERIKKWLKENGHEVEDFGTHSDASCDYPDFVVPAARAVADGRCERGFVLGGSGNGEAIAANKVRGVRCALVHDAFTAEMGRKHNDANVASFGSRVVAVEKMLDFVKIFIETGFEGGRHLGRIQKLAKVEDEEAARPARAAR
jgi:ribose 5-phosphate isomerase B